MDRSKIISSIIAAGIIGAVTSMAPATAGAQSAYDAYNYSYTDYYGTARSIALGNAFTALGGDIGGITVNPAGSGVYRYSEIELTLGGSFSRTASSISGNGISLPAGMGNSFRDGQNRFTMPNFGFVLNFDTYRSRGLKSVTVGLVYNRTHDYNMAFNGRGINSATSWAGALAANTMGISSSLLNGEDPYFKGLPWASVLGWETGAISNFGNAPDTEYAGITENIEQTGDGYNIYTGGPLDQRISYRTYGNKSDIILNAGFNFSDIIYAGVNLGFVMMDYTMDSRFSEFAVNSSDFQTGFISLHDRYVLQSSGRGFYAKFGIIAAPVAGLRIGAAIQTPTGTTISERWFEDLEVTTETKRDENGNMTGGRVSRGTPEGNYTYRLTSPFKYNVGIAYTFGRFGLLSIDYERVDYSSMKFKNTDGYEDEFEYANSDIDSQYGVSHNLRAGLEINVTPYVAIRGGFNFITPGEIAASNAKAYTFIYSGGLGFKTNGSFYADVAFRYGDYPDLIYRPYADYVPDSDNPDRFIASPQLRVKNYLMSFVATIGFRF